MEKAHADGLARAIGVSNFYPDRLIDLVEHADVVPAVNQIETHPFFQRHADQEIMQEPGIQMEAWRGFAQGRNTLFADPALRAIGEATGKSVGQVVRRWLSQVATATHPNHTTPQQQ